MKPWKWIIIVALVLASVGLSGCMLNRNPRLRNQAAATPTQQEALPAAPTAMDAPASQAEEAQPTQAQAAPTAAEATPPASAGTGSSSNQATDDLIKDLQGWETELNGTDLMDEIP